ncbi:MAG: hypothetical protein FWD64_11075 [Acidobacteriaceae bacterium]|nr:hypothetical protein [Acidobacteriaceae bacterium]
MAEAKPSLVPAEARDPKTYCDDLNCLLKVFVSDDVEWYVQLFAIVTGIPRDRVVDDALRYWWEMYGALATQRAEQNGSPDCAGN